MAEKMFSFTHMISETKLLALIASNADEVKVDIFVPERRGGGSIRPRLQNGDVPCPLTIEAPPQKKKKGAGIDRTALAKQWGVLRWGARQLILQTLYEHRDSAVTMEVLLAAGKPYGIGRGALSVVFGSMMKDATIARVKMGTYKILEKGIDVAFAAAQSQTVNNQQQRT